MKEYNELIIGTIRSSGGNNASRFIMVPPYATDYETALHESFEMPSDSANRLILTVHDYILGIEGMANIEQSTYSKEKHDKEMEIYSGLYEKFVSKGIPVLVGEIGGFRKIAKTERMDWIKTYGAITGSYGIPYVNWENAVNFGTINRETLGAYEQDYLDAMVNSWTAELPEVPVSLINGYDTTSGLIRQTKAVWADFWYGGEKDFKAYKYLKLDFSQASNDFTLGVAYTDETTESESRTKVDVSKGDKTAYLELDTSKKIRQVFLVCDTADFSVKAEKLVFTNIRN
ncbi:MAG: cellulase family glycosylhydrolase [Fibrobacteraceae bacterium]|nr:cellulase family glycosylhydrolase [Fibrobacteraceae bacterium]